MKCRRAKNLIHDFIDGVIGDPDRIALEQHLAECHSCEAMASSLSSSLDLLHSLPVEQLDENFTWKVRLRLARARNAAELDADTQRGWLKGWNTRFALSAAAAFVAVVGVGYFAVSSIEPGGLVPSERFVAQQPENQNDSSNDRSVAKSSRSAPLPNPRMVGGLTQVSMGSDQTVAGPAGPIQEFDDAAYLDSLMANVIKKNNARRQIRALEDQVNHLQTKLRDCESECKDGQ